MNLFGAALYTASREEFLTILVLLIFTVLLSLLFHRRIVSISWILSWTLAAPFFYFLITFRTASIATEIVNTFKLSLFFLFFGLLFSLLSFILSDIFRLIPRIRNIQERFNRYRWYVLFLSMLFLFISPSLGVLLGMLVPPKERGIVILISFIFFIFLWVGWMIYLYLKSAEAPPSKLEFKKIDYIIPGVLIIALLIVAGPSILHLFLDQLNSSCPDNIKEHFERQKFGVEGIKDCSYESIIIGDEELGLWRVKTTLQMAKVWGSLSGQTTLELLERNVDGAKIIYEVVNPKAMEFRTTPSKEIESAVLLLDSNYDFFLGPENYLRIKFGCSPRRDKSSSFPSNQLRFQDYDASFVKIEEELYTQVDVNYFLDTRGCLITGTAYFGITVNETKSQITVRRTPPLSIDSCDLLDDGADGCKCLFVLSTPNANAQDLNRISNPASRYSCEIKLQKMLDARKKGFRYDDSFIRNLEGEFVPKLIQTVLNETT